LSRSNFTHGFHSSMKMADSKLPRLKLTST
jgi:hypothetical protein